MSTEPELVVKVTLCFPRLKENDLFPVSWTYELCRHSECDSRIRELNWPSFSCTAWLLPSSVFVLGTKQRSVGYGLVSWVLWATGQYILKFPYRRCFCSCLARNLDANLDVCSVSVMACECKGCLLVPCWVFAHNVCHESFVSIWGGRL